MNSLQFRRSVRKAIGAGLALGLALASASGQSTAITVQEMGVGANEIVNISSSDLGSNLLVYGCILDLEVNNVPTLGFCIDPWHWSGDGPMAYNYEALSAGPKYPGNMSAATALQIEQLWNEFYSPNISNENAAGLQIAIWDLVSASVSLSTNGASWFTLNSPDDYGAANMIAWVNANPNATATDLSAVTGPGQDYVVMTSVLPLPPSASINAPATAFTGSPLTVTSTATAPQNNLTLHSIEWLSPTGAWTVDSAAASGANSQRTLGITFPSVGTWTARAGVSVDNGVSWVYSPNSQIQVTSGTVNYTLQSMAVPASSVASWYSPSSVVSRTYEVQHVNP